MRGKSYVSPDAGDRERTHLYVSIKTRHTTHQWLMRLCSSGRKKARSALGAKRFCDVTVGLRVPQRRVLPSSFWLTSSPVPVCQREGKMGLVQRYGYGLFEDGWSCECGRTCSDAPLTRRRLPRTLSSALRGARAVEASACSASHVRDMQAYATL